jgi:hypothetical protein
MSENVRLHLALFFYFEHCVYVHFKLLDVGSKNSTLGERVCIKRPTLEV